MTVLKAKDGRKNGEKIQFPDIENQNLKMGGDGKREASDNNPTNYTSLLR
jgi:hypothetical protein